MTAPDASQAPPRATAPVEPLPPPEPAEAEAEWEWLTLGSFGPRHWNLGCG